MTGQGSGRDVTQIGSEYFQLKQDQFGGAIDTASNNAKGCLTAPFQMIARVGNFIFNQHPILTGIALIPTTLDRSIHHLKDWNVFNGGGKLFPNSCEYIQEGTQLKGSVDVSLLSETLENITHFEPIQKLFKFLTESTSSIDISDLTQNDLVMKGVEQCIAASDKNAMVTSGLIILALLLLIKGFAFDPIKEE